jgi:hypothetical protein
VPQPGNPLSSASRIRMLMTPILALEAAFVSPGWPLRRCCWTALKFVSQ